MIDMVEPLNPNQLIKRKSNNWHKDHQENTELEHQLNLYKKHEI